MIGFVADRVIGFSSTSLYSDAVEKLVSFGIRKHSFSFILLNLPLVGGLYGKLYIQFPHRGVASGSFL